MDTLKNHFNSEWHMGITVTKLESGLKIIVVDQRHCPIQNIDFILVAPLSGILLNQQIFQPELVMSLGDIILKISDLFWKILDFWHVEYPLPTFPSLTLRSKTQLLLSLKMNWVY